MQTGRMITCPMCSVKHFLTEQQIRWGYRYCQKCLPKKEKAEQEMGRNEADPAPLLTEK